MPAPDNRVECLTNARFQPGNPLVLISSPITVKNLLDRNVTEESKKDTLAVQQSVANFNDGKTQGM